MEQKYIIKYRNQGKPEHTAPRPLEQAKTDAEFLKFQGATNVRIIEQAND